jgi:hypothetical protein
MKTKPKISGVNQSAAEQTTELLILADGRILARNLTPALARVLRAVNPDDAGMSRRAAAFKSSSHAPTPSSSHFGRGRSTNRLKPGLQTANNSASQGLEFRLQAVGEPK